MESDLFTVILRTILNVFYFWKYTKNKKNKNIKC